MGCLSTNFMSFGVQKLKYYYGSNWFETHRLLNEDSKEKWAIRMFKLLFFSRINLLDLIGWRNSGPVVSAAYLYLHFLINIVWYFRRK